MPIHVYIADDHRVVREGLQALLETDPDIKVVGSAPDGRTAVREVKRLSPDVVLMDIAMPGLNGIEATRKIIETCSPSIRVIILSMLTSDEHILRALRAGAAGYLIKECAGKEVIQAVHTVYSGKSYIHSDITGVVIQEYLRCLRNSPPASPLDRLSLRELEVLQLVVEGKSSRQIADILFLSPKTVETYRSRVMQKLEIKNLPALVKFAIRHGVTSVEN